MLAQFSAICGATVKTLGAMCVWAKNWISTQLKHQWMQHFQSMKLYIGQPPPWQQQIVGNLGNTEIQMVLVKSGI